MRLRGVLEPEDAEALHPYPDGLVIATKSLIRRIGPNGRAEQDDRTSSARRWRSLLRPQGWG